MDVQDDLAVLALYNQRAAELKASSFLHHARARSGPVFHLHGGPFRALREGGPTGESMKAFLLTFRLFVQDRDGLSFRAIARLFAKLAISEQLKQEMAEIRKDVNRYLDGCSHFVIEGETISRRTLLDTWMYGELAHLNSDKRAILRQWRVEDDVRPLFQHEFEAIIVHLTHAIFCARTLVERAISEMAPTQEMEA